MVSEKHIVDSIFLAAIELPPDQLPAYLDRACGEDSALRARLERLLAAQAQNRSFLESPAPELGATADCRVAEAAGSTIGPYKLLQQIGEGGMGAVFMAVQSEPIHRTVALKIIKPGMDTRQVIARFEAERQALAMMDHPNIAKVLDAGTTGGDGSQGPGASEAKDARRLSPDPRPLGATPSRPYFVMELVRGVPITQYCDDKQLSLRDRLELFLPVCHAVQHAHQKGVIHRDLKPTNVLVAEYDDEPVPKVIDFGVAKATAQKLTERTMFTEFGQLVGTFEYMSPEQAKLNQLDIDTRSDVYSLGVLLYELLTGATPFERKRLQEAAFDEMLRIIREEEPPKPSTRLSAAATLPSVAAKRHSEPAQLSKEVSGELDWIVMRCLEKDRNRRYDSAASFASDLARYLRGDVVAARPSSASYRLKKFMRRHRTPFVAGSLVAVVLVVGSMVAAWQAVRAGQAAGRERATAIEMEKQRDRARQAETQAVAAGADAEAFSAFLVNDVLAAARPAGVGGGLGVDVTVRLALEAAEGRMTETFAGRPRAEAKARHALGATFYQLGQYDLAERNLERAAELAEEVHGADASETLMARKDLGHVLVITGRTEEALPLLEQAAQQALTDDITPAALSMRANVAWSLSLADRPDESIAILETSLDQARRQLGDDEPSVLYAMSRMADIYRRHGRHADALELYEDVVERLKAGAGRDDLDSLEILYSVSSVGIDQNQLEATEGLLERVADGYRRHLGPRHPELAFVLGKLGECQRRGRQFAQAETTVRESLAILETTAPNSWGYFHELFRLGTIISDQQRHAEAEPLIARGYEGMKASSELIPIRDEAEHMGLKWLGAVQAYQGRRAKAVELFRQALEQRPNDDHTHWLCGEQLAFQGKFAEAAKFYVRAYELAPEHHDHILDAAVSALESGDRIAYERVCSLALKQFGETDDPVAADRTAKAGLLVALPPDKIRPFARLADVAVTRGASHQWLQYFQLVRGMAAYRKGDWPGTLDWCRRSREAAGSFFPLVAMNELFESMAHHRLGQSDDARAHFDRASRLIDEYLESADKDRGDAWHDWLMCQIIRREAQQLFEDNAPPNEATSFPSEETNED